MPRILAKNSKTTRNPDLITATDVGSKRALDVNIADGDVTINTGDIELGAVELKDATTEARAAVGANGLAVDVKDISNLTFTIDNTELHTFQNAATSTGNGTAYTVGGQKTLLISITGANVSTSTVQFYGGDSDGEYALIMGVRMSDFNTATSSSTVFGATPEQWQFDITGLTTVRMAISTLTGTNAAVTVKGKSVG